jgi:hypothetical protein
MYNFLFKNIKVENKYTKNKRSKSETLLTLVLNTNNTNISSKHLATIQNGETKSKNFFSLMTRRRSSKGSNKSSNLISATCVDPKTLAAVESNAAKSKSNVNLNIVQGGGNNEDKGPRRFSLRSFFSKSGGGRSNADNASIGKDPKNCIENGPMMNRNMSNSLSQSINSNDMPNSRPMTPVRLQSLTNATGSAIKFHQSFKLTNSNAVKAAAARTALQNNNNTNNSSSMRTTSDMNVNRLDSAPETNFRDTFLSLDTRRELYQKAKEFSNSMRREDDDDMDKCFNEYATKSGVGGGATTANFLTPADSDRAMRNSLSRQMNLREKYAIDGVDNDNYAEKGQQRSSGGKQKKSTKSRKQLFAFLFKNKNVNTNGGVAEGKCAYDTNKMNGPEEGDDFGRHFERHRRSRTLDAAAKKKFKMFAKRNNSAVGSEKNAGLAASSMGNYLDSYVYGADFSDPEETTTDNNKENGKLFCSLLTIYSN